MFPHVNLLREQNLESDKQKQFLNPESPEA